VKPASLSALISPTEMVVLPTPLQAPAMTILGTFMKSTSHSMTEDILIFGGKRHDETKYQFIGERN
jgi:hypothetical protein